jgi:hypothetical protein
LAFDSEQAADAFSTYGTSSIRDTFHVVAAQSFPTFEYVLSAEKVQRLEIKSGVASIRLTCKTFRSEKLPLLNYPTIIVQELWAQFPKGLTNMGLAILG